MSHTSHLLWMSFAIFKCPKIFGMLFEAVSQGMYVQIMIYNSLTGIRAFFTQPPFVVTSSSCPKWHQTSSHMTWDPAWCRSLKIAVVPTTARSSLHGGTIASIWKQFENWLPSRKRIHIPPGKFRKIIDSKVPCAVWNMLVPRSVDHFPTYVLSHENNPSYFPSYWNRDPYNLFIL